MYTDFPLSGVGVVTIGMSLIIAGGGRGYMAYRFVVLVLGMSDDLIFTKGDGNANG